MSDPYVDLTPALVAELRAGTDIAALVGARVRTDEPHGATATYEGDARGPGEYVPFLVVSHLSLPADRRVPVMRAAFGLRCYGRTKEEATAIFLAVAGELHDRGPRLHTDGTGIYSSAVTGGAKDRDPKTNQPVVTGTIELTASTMVVTA